MKLGRCGSCSYWEAEVSNAKVVEIQTSGNTAGHCHKGPPLVFPVNTSKGIMFQTAFPMPHSNMWCAAFQPKVTQ